MKEIILSLLLLFTVAVVYCQDDQVDPDKWSCSQNVEFDFASCNDGQKSVKFACVGNAANPRAVCEAGLCRRFDSRYVYCCSRLIVSDNFTREQIDTSCFRYELQASSPGSLPVTVSCERGDNETISCCNRATGCKDYSCDAAQPCDDPAYRYCTFDATSTKVSCCKDGTDRTLGCIDYSDCGGPCLVGNPPIVICELSRDGISRCCRYNGDRATIGSVIPTACVERRCSRCASDINFDGNAAGVQFACSLADDETISCCANLDVGRRCCKFEKCNLPAKDDPPVTVCKRNLDLGIETCCFVKETVRFCRTRNIFDCNTLADKVFNPACRGGFLPVDDCRRALDGDVNSASRICCFDSPGDSDIKPECLEITCNSTGPTTEKCCAVLSDGSDRCTNIDKVGILPDRKDRLCQLNADTGIISCTATLCDGDAGDRKVANTECASIQCKKPVDGQGFQCCVTLKNVTRCGRVTDDRLIVKRILADIVRNNDGTVTQTADFDPNSPGKDQRGDGKIETHFNGGVVRFVNFLKDQTTIRIDYEIRISKTFIIAPDDSIVDETPYADTDFGTVVATDENFGLGKCRKFVTKLSSNIAATRTVVVIRRVCEVIVPSEDTDDVQLPDFVKFSYIINHPVPLEDFGKGHRVGIALLVRRRADDAAPDDIVISDDNSSATIRGPKGDAQFDWTQIAEVLAGTKTRQTITVKVVKIEDVADGKLIYFAFEVSDVSRDILIYLDPLTGTGAQAASGTSSAGDGSGASRLELFTDLF